MNLNLDNLISIFESPIFLKTVRVVLTVIFYYFVIKFANFIIKKGLARFAKKFEDIESQKQIVTVQTVAISAIDTILFGIMIFEILEAIGIDIRPLLAAAGVVGVAIGFGAKSFVEDIISGLTILLSGQIRVGDFVEIGSSSGTVQKINIRMIMLRDLQGAVHYIRNGLVDKIINYTREFSFAVFDVEVAYKEDIIKVIDVLKELGTKIREEKAFKKKILDNIEILGLDKFGSSAITVKCRIKTLPASQWEVFRAFNLLIKEEFDKRGIEIPFTQITVHQPQM